jgi:hypothetical protein
MKTPFHSSARSRGSLLIVAMILCAVIGISIASYLNLARTGMQISDRALYNNAAMNLAENGLEQGMYAINKKISDPSFDWAANSWTLSGADARQKWTSTIGQGAGAETRAYVYGYAGTAPAIVARSIITPAGGSSRTIEKWVYVQLRKTSKFSNGLVAKNSITFQGNNASVDSWNSEKNDDGTPRASPVPYSSAVDHDRGSVGSISVAVDSVLVKNADIWGYASTGAATLNGQIAVGANGLIGPYGTPRTPPDNVDATRVSTDFSANVEPESTPTTGTAHVAITGNGSGGTQSLPYTLGTTGTTTVWRIPSISSSGNVTNVLTINGDVTIIVTASAGSSAIDLAGQTSINITTGSSLKIYTEGNVSIAGNGVLNGGTTAATANQPKSFQIFGTRTSTGQTVKIAGNGVLSGVVYAPNADVTINGNGDVMGSVVGNNITLTGNAAFHYDESLADLDGGSPFRISNWQELTSTTTRSLHSTQLTF